MAPLPTLILLGGSVSQGIDQDTALSFYGIMELIIVVLGILGAALFAYLTRPPSEEQGPSEIDEND